MERQTIREQRLSHLPKNAIEYYQGFNQPFILSIMLQSCLSALELKILIYMGFSVFKLYFTMQEIFYYFGHIDSETRVNEGISNLLDRNVLIQVEDSLIINLEFMEWAVS